MARAPKFSNLVQYFVSIQTGERLKTFLLFNWLFLFICGYYVLRPIRRGLVLEGLGNENMPFVYVGTALATGVVVWLYSKFTHLPRRTLIGTIYGIFFVNLLAWWQIFHWESAIAAGVFWVWLDVFSIMGVTLFWMYANDVFNSASARRLFGIVAAGGGLGAILGSSLTAGLVDTLGAVNMILVSAGIVLANLFIFLTLERVNEKSPTVRSTASEFKDEKYDLSQFSKILSVIFTNRFLFFLMMVVAFERITPDLIQFLYHEILVTQASGTAAIAALDANLERWRGIFEFCVELFFVAAILRRFGSKFCLSSSAMTIFFGLVAFCVMPNPFVILFIFQADEAIRHSWFKAAKELTYTVTSRDVLYNVKPVIEMLFYRCARGVAGLSIYLVNTVFGLGAAGVIALGIGAAGIWSYCAFRLSNEFKRLDEEQTKAVETEKPEPVAV